MEMNIWIIMSELKCDRPNQHPLRRKRRELWAWYSSDNRGTEPITSIALYKMVLLVVKKSGWSGDICSVTFLTETRLHCETGWWPWIGCDKILRVSEIYLLTVWLLLRPTDQPVEMTLMTFCGRQFMDVIGCDLVCVSIVQVCTQQTSCLARDF